MSDWYTIMPDQRTTSLITDQHMHDRNPNGDRHAFPSKCDGSVMWHVALKSGMLVSDGSPLGHR